MFRYGESVLKPSLNLKQEHFNFTCHCWISDDRLLAGTDQGKLFVVQNGEILHEIKIDTKPEQRLNCFCLKKKNYFLCWSYL